MLERNIAIVGDGATDRAIFKKISECILSDGDENNVTLNYIELSRQNIHDAVERYCKEVNKINSGCYLTGEQASQFRKSVTTHIPHPSVSQSVIMANATLRVIQVSTIGTTTGIE
ncbi:hypothetical protein [Aphanizomenon flos-aquae]|jgi:hypothetical protein|uniref:hypothetical protein n=1 Tax=Aphanizomenon flos-aquae TaxID=1176 RepID=UPI001F5531BD|nr:hypothetical protein [Aphanizomenon flos-aquae]